MLYEEKNHNLRTNIPYLPIEYSNVEASGNVLTAVNDAILMPFSTPGIFTFSNAVIGIVTSSGNLDLGIYDKFGNKVVSLGSTASPGTGRRAFALSATLRPGLNPYYFAFASSNTTISVDKHYSGSPDIIKCLKFSSSFPLPATVNIASPSAREFKWCEFLLEASGGPAS